MAGVSLKVQASPGNWVPAQNVWVYDPSGNWVQAKSVKRADGAGNWTLVWVPLSTVTVTGPAATISAESGLNGAVAPYHAPSIFTVTLGNTEPITTVVLQESSDGVTWADFATWNAPVAAELSFPYVLSAAGNWLIRAKVSHLDGRIAYSDNHAITSYTKNLVGVTSNGSPEVFEPFLLSADCGAACLPTPTSTKWLYRRVSGGPDAPWVVYGSGAGNPQEVYQPRAEPYEWTFREDFADGSTIFSSMVTVTATALVSHFHEVVPPGGDIQISMDRAREWFEINRPVPVNFDDEVTMACVELMPNTTYVIGADELFYRRGVRLVGNGATIEGWGTHIFKGDDHGSGEYTARNRDWQIINTVFDCRSAAGGLSSAHVFRYRLDRVTIKNIQGGKHHIEINSSGGPVSTTDYNVEIINCSFYQTVVDYDEVRAEDEAIQLDYSWDGAAPDVANDGTVTNNVLIRGCTFNQLPRAIGGHVYNSQATLAAGIHSHILIEGNTITNINPNIWSVGDPNSRSSEGAVRLYYWRDVTIQDNYFGVCLQPLMIYSPDNSAGAAYSMGLTSILRNTFANCGGLDGNGDGRHCVYGNAASGGKKIGQVIFEDNVLSGTWSSAPAGKSSGYFAGFDDTEGALPSPDSAYNVVMRRNQFKPDGLNEDAEAGYNKYRSGNDTNGGEAKVLIDFNTISNGMENNT